MSVEEFTKTATPWIRQTVSRPDVDLALISSVLQPRCEVLGDIPEQVDFIDTLPDYDLELFVSKKMKTNKETSLETLKAVLPVIEGMDNFSCESIHDALFGLVETLGVKNGFVLWPVRIAASGKQFTPGGAIEVAAILGKDETIRRIKIAIERLSADN